MQEQRYNHVPGFLIGASFKLLRHPERRIASLLFTPAFDCDLHEKGTK